MRTTRRWTSTLTRAALLVAVAAAWVLLAPSRFGGQTAYVIVAGASMEPTLHQGDLVLARPAPSYEVGEVVTYHHPQVGPVIHRIIDRQGSHYTLQGDANAWIDSYAPTGAEIVGQSWLVVRTPVPC
jgi:signal peptidase I